MISWKYGPTNENNIWPKFWPRAFHPENKLLTKRHILRKQLSPDIWSNQHDLLIYGLHGVLNTYETPANKKNFEIEDTLL